MSLDKVHLRKILQLFDAPPQLRRRLLRADIRNEIGREAGIVAEGGDFFSPFWADVKRHVANQGDLSALVLDRIKRNEGRRRLYPMLADGFLKWWDEKRRWRNEEFNFIPQNVKAKFDVEAASCVVKVENLLGLEVGDQFDRIIYSYFSESPVLTAESARIGLWVLANALSNYSSEDLRILDVLRSASFGIADNPLRGTEEKEFAVKHKALVAEWNILREEYDP